MLINDETKDYYKVKGERFVYHAINDKNLGCSYNGRYALRWMSASRDIFSARVRISSARGSIPVAVPIFTVDREVEEIIEKKSTDDSCPVEESLPG
jgi:hypothetical protein